MRYLALCCDYDGTLASHGKVLPDTLAALERLIASGRRLLLVTGRQIDDLQRVCERLDLFEYVVAENGALLYHPATRTEEALASPPPDAFVARLRERGVEPLSQGRVIVATWEPHESAVLATIRDLGLELQVIFNKGAVMILPAGVNKATGLLRALERLGLSPHNAVGIGDAENDHALLRACECAAVVANALPTLKDAADIVTQSDHGAGVAELIDALLKDDLASYEHRLTRHHILVGTEADGTQIKLPPYGQNVLLIGTSGSGKSTLATGFLERLADQKYTFCVIDPEGDYDAFAGAVVIGAPTRPPAVDEVVQLLAKPETSCIVNLVGLPIADRPAFFASLAPRLQELRARSGRPHWLLIDEAHHVLPAEFEPGPLALPERLTGVLQISVHPELIAPKTLRAVQTLIVVGKNPGAAFRALGKAVSTEVPDVSDDDVAPGHALLWHVGASAPVHLKIAPSRTERRRHTRKYAEGELPRERSFYFRGADKKLNLRAPNLIQFLQLAEGVDDETWLYHLRNGDYAAWFREAIKDSGLAATARAVQHDSRLTPAESRARIREAIEQQYTLPATAKEPETLRARSHEGSEGKK
jgi:HAD superfamily hydrolase (TIGR01484 family)